MFAKSSCYNLLKENYGVTVLSDCVTNYDKRKIEEMLQCKIYLELYVKVREDWRNRNPILNNLGYKDHK